MASQMNLVEDDQAKSLTFSALNLHVLLPVGLDDSFSKASCGVTMKLGLSAVTAVRRFLCNAVNTSSGLVRRPVEETT